MKPKLALSRDGKTLTVTIPMQLRRRSGRKVIIGPDNLEAWAPVPPQADSTLVRALAKAHRWKRLLESGDYATVTELAKAEGVNLSYLCRVLQLTLLAPHITEAILDSRMASLPPLAELWRNVPRLWGEQMR